MHVSGKAEEPLAVAARSESRLVRALRRIGITLGSSGAVPYADINALGEPIVVIGAIDARVADQLSDIVEAAERLAFAVHDDRRVEAET
jgi:hypothetical protein